MSGASSALWVAGLEERLQRLEAGQAALLGITMRLLARSFQETGIPTAVWNEVIDRTALASDEVKSRPGLSERERQKMTEVARIVRTFRRTSDEPKRRKVQ